MREGEPTGSAFVVRGGRFEVDVGGRVVRELGPGEVLGELALLTGEPRSASVRARRDSVVCELPREAFDQAVSDDPAAARFVLRQVAERLRTAGEPARPPRATPPSVVAVVGPARRRRRGRGRRPPDPPDGPAPAGGPAGLRRRRRPRPGRADPRPGRPGRGARRRGRRAPVAGLLPPRGRRRGAGGRRRSRPQAPVVPAPACRPELVLLGPPPTPARRADWVLAVDAWQLTLVSGDLATALRPVADRLAGRSLGTGPGRRRCAGVRPRRRAPRARGRRATTSTGSRAPASAAIIAALWADGRHRSAARGRLLRRVGAPQAVQRLGAPGALPVQGPSGRAPG